MRCIKKRGGSEECLPLTGTDTAFILILRAKRRQTNSTRTVQEFLSVAVKQRQSDFATVLPEKLTVTKMVMKFDTVKPID
jgi:hypothetical protein